MQEFSTIGPVARCFRPTESGSFNDDDLLHRTKLKMAAAMEVRRSNVIQPLDISGPKLHAQSRDKRKSESIVQALSLPKRSRGPPVSVFTASPSLPPSLPLPPATKASKKVVSTIAESLLPIMEAESERSEGTAEQLSDQDDDLVPAHLPTALETDGFSAQQQCSVGEVRSEPLVTKFCACCLYARVSMRNCVLLDFTAQSSSLCMFHFVLQKYYRPNMLQEEVACVENAMRATLAAISSEFQVRPTHALTYVLFAKQLDFQLS